MDNLQGLKAVALYRVSTDLQDEDMQKKECREFCIKNNIELIDEYIEHDVSGFKTPLIKREELIKILNRAEYEKDFDVFLVYNQDRISRRQDEAPRIIQDLFKNKVRCFEANGNEIKVNSHSDKLINYINSWTAELESIKTSMRVKSAMKNMNQTGKFLGGVPYGYKTVITDKMTKKGKMLYEICINEEEKDIVKKIFDLCLNYNYGAVRIANYLNEHNYRTRNNKYWRSTTICRMLKNTIYIGYKQYNKSISTRDKRINTYEYKKQPFNERLKLIEEDTFNKVQKLLQARKKRKGKEINGAIKSNTLCSGLLFCPCGAKLRTRYTIISYHRKKDNKNIKKYQYYYYCPNARENKINHKKITSKLRYNSNIYDTIIDKAMLNVINNFSNTIFNIAINNFNYNLNSSNEKKISVLLKQREDINKLIEKYSIFIDRSIMNGDTTETEIYINNITRNKEKSANIQSNINSLKKDLNANINISISKDNLSTIYSKVPLDIKKAILNKLVDKIIINKDESLEMYLKI